MYQRGIKVDFKGNQDFKAFNGTYIWASCPHLIMLYYIQHPDGDLTKEIMKNSKLGDGFEQPHSKYFNEGLKYIAVTEDEISLHEINIQK